jgi:predicted transcriptional regulator
MKTLSLKLDDHIFEETEQVTGYLKKSRNRYINEALEHYNKLQKRALLAARLAEESKLVSKESMDVLKEFEMLGDESEAI